MLRFHLPHKVDRALVKELCRRSQRKRARIRSSTSLIPNLIDQNPWVQWHKAIDMMRHG